ncbi:carboxylate--amine ligase [Bacillaceae bacterium W0354]
MKKKILFLDGDKRATLSIIRSIAKLKKYQLLVSGTSQLDLCRFSNHTDKFFVYDDPEKDHGNFINSFKQIIHEVDPDYIFPCSDLTLYSIYHSDLYMSISEKLMAPPREEYLMSFNKGQMNEIVKKNNLKVIEDVCINSCEFPIVVKPSQSRYLIDNRVVYGFRQFVQNRSELGSMLQQMRRFGDVLIQRKIEGKGYGVFAAAKEGKPIVFFAHERIREVPPGGGVSTLRRAKQVHPQLLLAATKIIESLNWTGIIMVEFKGESESEAYFMEVNGRPWGSMDLAVSSGVDFPQIMVDLFIQRLSYEELLQKYNKTYETNYYSRWITGEINYIRYAIKSNLSIKEKVKLIKGVLLKQRNESYDTFRWKDPIPFLIEIFNVCRNFSFLRRMKPRK